MTDPRAATLTALRAVLRDAAQAEALVAPACDWQVSAPLAPMVGAAAVDAGLWAPLRAAFTGLHRRDEIFIGGADRRAEGGWWCAAVTHYVGTFAAPLWGIAPSGHLAVLRAGEFYRVEDGCIVKARIVKARIVQARIILDLPDLLRQGGLHPFAFAYGLETLFPGPATHDGVLPAAGDGTRSLDIVEGMPGALDVFDPHSFGSAGQTGTTGYWHDDMMWYGPAGIGSNLRWEGFVKDHREPFLRAFPDRKGGNHHCRIGDGFYGAISGWPLMTMTFQGDYLGVRADGRPPTLRVMDFYRCTDTQIAETWVFLDYVDRFAQMGVDLLGDDRARAG